MNGITQEELATLEEKIRELKAEIDSYNLDTLWEQANGLRAEIDGYNLDTLWEKANALNAEISTIHKDYGSAKSLHIDQEKYLHINASGEHPGIKVNQQTPKLFDVNNGQLRVTPEGKIGIGITSPGEKLHVDGSIRGDQKGALRINTGYGYIDIGPQDKVWSHFHTDRTKYYFDKEIQVDTGRIGSYNGENLHLCTSGTTRITAIQDNGNVGIGTTTPKNRLDIEGGAVIGTEYSGTHPAPANGLLVQGNVGIGTVNPQDKLDVNGALRFNGNADRRVYGASRANRNTVVLDGHWNELEVKGRVIDWTGPNLHIGYNNNHAANYIEIGRKVGHIRFMSGGGTTETMRITGSKVGIGITAPKAKLDVNGRIFRKGQAFSISGTGSHGKIVKVPWGNRTSWNIFVAPRVMGREEGASEGDNALLKFECYAKIKSNTEWTIVARFKYRIRREGEGDWKNGSVNYLLVPR